MWLEEILITRYYTINLSDFPYVLGIFMDCQRGKLLMLCVHECWQTILKICANVT